MSTKHTPGPWVARLASFGKRTITNGDKDIASVFIEDDAHLIAAAPELLGACKAQLRAIHLAMSGKARYFLDDSEDASPYISSREDYESYLLLRAAIAKAEGTEK